MLTVKLQSSSGGHPIVTCNMVLLTEPVTYLMQTRSAHAQRARLFGLCISVHWWRLCGHWEQVTGHHCPQHFPRLIPSCIQIHYNGLTHLNTVIPSVHMLSTTYPASSVIAEAHKGWSIPAFCTVCACQNHPPPRSGSLPFWTHACGAVREKLATHNQNIATSSLRYAITAFLPD